MPHANRQWRVRVVVHNGAASALDEKGAGGLEPIGIVGDGKPRRPRAIARPRIRSSRGRVLSIGARAEPAVSETDVDHAADRTSSRSVRIAVSATAGHPRMTGVETLVDRWRPLSLVLNSQIERFLQPLQLQDQRGALRAHVIARAMVMQRLEFAVTSISVGGFHCGAPAATRGALAL